MSQFHDTQCSSPVHGSATVFLGGDFLSKFPPSQACISIIVSRHAKVKRLASALIYYTAVIVILSLTALAGFFLFFFFHQSFLL